MRATLDPLLDPNRPVLVGFFKLHNGSARNITRHQQNRTQPRRNTKYLPNVCVREQPVPGNSDTIDIEQLLKLLLPVDTVVEETGQPTPESQEADDRASGNVA